jgi:hypothetical protein
MTLKIVAPVAGKPYPKAFHAVQWKVHIVPRVAIWFLVGLDHEPSFPSRDPTILQGPGDIARLSYLQIQHRIDIF